MPARRGTAPWGGVLPWFWLAGLLHWAWFLDFGRLNYAVLDWQMQRAYDAEWSQALRHATLPWTTASPIHDTVMFLGNPEVPLDPFILLTAWCPPAAVDLLRLLAWYTAGFLGTVALGRDLRLSRGALAAVLLLVNLNGFITAHLAVGHLVWLGYFLLPWFVRDVLRWRDTGPRAGAPARMALILSAMALAGSFELCLWCAFFLALIAIARPGWLAGLGRLGVLVAALCAVRILPGLTAFPRLSQDFVGGFPNWRHLAAGLAVIRTFRYPTIDATGHHFGWHEYDFYIGVPGLALLAAGLLLARARKLHALRFRALDVPVAALALFSLDGLYRFPAMLPGLGVERVSTRLLILPLVFLIPLAAARVDRVFDGLTPGRRGRWMLAGLVVLAAGLLRHSWTWRHAVLGGYIGTLEPMWPLPVPGPLPPGAYRLALAAGAAVSSGTLGLVLARLRPWRRRAAPRHP